MSREIVIEITKADWENGREFVQAKVDEAVNLLAERLPLDMTASNEIDRLRATNDRLVAMLEKLLWPNVPSADDVALLVRMCGTTKTQDSAMELVERLRVAQALGRAMVKEFKT